MGIIKDFESKTNTERCKEFLDWISSYEPYCENNQVCEMHLKENGEIESSQNEIYCYFSPFSNTRMLMTTEINIEFENKTDINENFIACGLTMIELLNRGMHFVVLYAPGMKSPHIRIYDFLPKHLDEKTAAVARERFTKAVVPVQYHSIIDRAFYHRHKLCLEFAKHWKHGTTLEVYEYGAM